MEVDIEGRGKAKATYRIGVLNTFEQVHVARRLSPVMAGLVASLAGKLDDLNAMTEIGILHLLVGPASAALAGMKQEDADYVMNTCLAVCERKDGEGWQKVLATKGALVYDDINFPAMIKLVVAVVRKNLGDFIPGLGDA